MNKQLLTLACLLIGAPVLAAGPNGLARPQQCEAWRCRTRGEGDRCTVRRKGGGAEAALLRNHSYGKGEQASAPARAP
jgi:hypothetical protein